jgi:hypothetical protein
VRYLSTCTEKANTTSVLKYMAPLIFFSFAKYKCSYWLLIRYWLDFDKTWCHY